MLVEFATWWTQQMRALLPAALLPGRHAGAVLVRDTGSVPRFRVCGRGPDTPLDPRRVAGRPVVLAVPAGVLLEQRVSLPLAAERDVAAVLRFEMDRLTPFRADALFWTWLPVRRDVAGSRLLLRLLLVPRTAVAASLAALDALGARPVALEVSDAGVVRRLPVAPLDGAVPRRLNARLAATACAVLLAALVVGPVMRQERAIAATERNLAAMQPRLAGISVLRRRLAEGAGTAALFATEAGRVGNPLQAIALLTEALPDDAFLQTLSMRERAVVISGRAASAAGLIAGLAARAGLRDPAFDAAVTRVADHSELFSIRLTVAP